MRTVVLVVAAVAGIGALLGAQPQSIPGFTNPSAVGGAESPLATGDLPTLGQAAPGQTIGRGTNFPDSTKFGDLKYSPDDDLAGAADTSRVPVPPPTRPPGKAPAAPRNTCTAVYKGSELTLSTPDGRSGFVQTPQGILAVPCLPAGTNAGAR